MASNGSSARPDGLIVPDGPPGQRFPNRSPTVTGRARVPQPLTARQRFPNRSGAYQPPPGQRIRNLPSEGVITQGGGLGSAAATAEQLTASDTTTFSVTPQITGSYQTLPQPNTTCVAPGCDGQQPGSPDARFPANLPNGPYQITKYVPYFDDHSQYGGGCELFGAYVGDPLHRFYQMSQQTLGYNGQLNTWVANTAGDDNPNPATVRPPVITNAER